MTTDDIARLERRVERERAARREAERLLEEKARDLYLANRQLEDTNRSLGSTNDQLEQSLRDLRSTRAQLERSEQLAALGRVVAGIAHEVNTPLGVALTAVSVLQEATDDLASRMSTGKMTRSDLQTFLDDAREAAALSTTNLQRAAQIIQSFKRVASDRTSRERREINLGTYLDEVLFSLRPMVHRGGLTVHVVTEGDLQAFTDPGAIAQVFTNLLENSIHHGYAGEGGRVEVTLAGERDTIRWTYRDHGRGMDADTSARAFEPFFTTRRHQGGTGLGLHVLHSLVSGALGGTVQLDTAPGAGVTLTLCLPRQAPPMS
jgi:signal transduction histidine kinase